MFRTVVIDEFHITVLVRRGLRPAECGAIHRTLNRATFQAEVRRALRSVFGRYRPLAKVQVTLSR